MEMIDFEVKMRGDFENDAAFEMYAEENWYKILIHNMAVVGSRLDSLVRLEEEKRRARALRWKLKI